MTPKENLNAGGKANLEFVSEMQKIYPDQEVIPNQCLSCSTAWNEATHFRADKIQSCPGHTEEEVEAKIVIEGEEIVWTYIVGRCHMAEADKSL